MASNSHWTNLFKVEPSSLQRQINSHRPDLFKMEPSSLQRQINSHWPNLFKVEPSSPQHQISTSSTMSAKKSSADEGTSSSPEKRENTKSKARWNPLPEQKDILENIFNSGMKNPGREDIMKITEMLQKYGHVAEASIFYWFQNKKSRMKKKQRLDSACSFTPSTGEFSSFPMPPSALLPQQMNGISSAPYPNAAITGGVIQNNSTIIHTGSGANNQNASLLTVFINGFPFDASKGPLNVWALFGKNAVLFHSSGQPVLVDQQGFIVPDLQHGAMCYLVYV